MTKGHIVVALAQELHERVDGHERVLDLVGDARHHAREQLELLGRPPFQGELALGRQVLEDQHRAHRRRALAHDGIRGDLEWQAAQRQLDLTARDRATAREGLVEEIAEGRGQGAQVAVQDVTRRHAQDLLGASVHDHHALLGTDADDPARHALEYSLVELFLVLELMMNADVADRGGEVARQVEQGLGLPPPIGAARDALAERQDADQVSVRGERDRDHRLQHSHLPGDLACRGICRPPLRLLDLNEPSFGHEPERQAAIGGEADRFDHVAREPAGSAHAVLPVLVVREKDGAPARAGQLGDGVEE